jgi:hypothetical protein
MDIAEVSVLYASRSQSLIFADNIIVDDQEVSTSFKAQFGAVWINEAYDTIIIANNVIRNWAGDSSIGIAIYLHGNTNTQLPAIINGNTIHGDFLRMINVGSDCIVTNNSFEGGSRALQLRATAKNVIVKNNSFDVTTPFYNDSFVPDTFAVDDNIGAPLTNGTATLTTGATPAARVNNVAWLNQENADLKATLKATSSPGANWAIEHYFEWNNVNSQWDLIIKWKTDPGSNVDVNYKIGRIS